MERDFLGLNSKESVAVVKEEALDGYKDHVFMGGPRMQWAFRNKVPAPPHFMSFRETQEEKPKNMIFDSLTSSAFQPISPLNVFDHSHKPSSGVSQAYPLHSVDANGVTSAHRFHEVRAFPVANNSFSVATNNPFFKIHGAVNGPNMVTNPVKQQHVGGIPLTTPHSVVPIMGSLSGTYGPRNISKPVAAPAQLTIFYAGEVNVFDDISPEKAQAIMFLAANGSSKVANAVNTRAQVPTSAPKHVVGEGIHGNQSQVTSPCSGLSSPMSVSSHPSPQSAGTSSNTDDLIAMKSMGAKAPSSRSETPEIVTSIGSVAGTLVPAAVPQARKASLARFLEKRKERVTNAAPYSCKKPMEDAFGSDVAGFPGKSHEGLIIHSSGK